MFCFQLRYVVRYWFLLSSFAQILTPMLENPIPEIYVVPLHLPDTYSNERGYRDCSKHLAVPVLYSSIHPEKHYRQHSMNKLCRLEILCVHNKSFFVLFMVAAILSSLLEKSMNLLAHLKFSVVDAKWIRHYLRHYLLSQLKFSVVDAK